MNSSFWLAQHRLSRRYSRSAALLVSAVIFCLGTSSLSAQETGQQQGAIQGLVTSEETGQPLSGVAVILLRNGDPQRTVVTDRNGLYLIGSVPPGSYSLRVQLLGYTEEVLPATLLPGDRLTLNVRLDRNPLVLEGVSVEVPGGAAVRELGRQIVTPRDLRLVPAPAASSDLATYLQILPGVVTMGDRGGQMFVRGGSHSENLTLMDGLLIHQPFHITGGFSVFPEDLIESVDYYAGGFGARYSGRISSVIDVRMRDGNRSRLGVVASASPILAEALVEGPVMEGRFSIIASYRRSLIEETSEHFLPELQPFTFQSHYFKITEIRESGSRCALTFLRTADRGRLDVKNIGSRVSWGNTATGARCTALFDGGLSFIDVNVGYSGVRNASVVRGSSELFSVAKRWHGELVTTQLAGSTRFDAGVYGYMEAMHYDLTELFGRQVPKDQEEAVTIAGGFFEWTIPIRGGITLQPGLTMSMNPPRQGLEPRMRASWKPWAGVDGELSGALGYHRQHIAGVSDTRDAGSVFVVWFPTADNVPTSLWHTQLGWQQKHSSGVQWAIEGYYRKIRAVTVPLWSSIAEFNTELGLANGTAYGGDARVEYTSPNFYGFLGYGYNWLMYEAAEENFGIWFGEALQEYRPAHDRRHQVNAVASLDWKGFTIGGRWQFGTGFPFTRPMGFDEGFDFRFRLDNVVVKPGTTRLLAEKPYRGRLPLVHRLDLSIRRNFDFSFGALETQVGAMNLYDRANMFYYDIYLQNRIDQLPLVPFVSLKTRMP